MKAVLALIALSGFILSIDATCSSGNCPNAIGSGNCTALKNYISCEQKEADGCKATGGDIAKKVAIEALITTAKAERTLHACGACAVTVSITTLVLCLMAFFVKL